MNDPEHDQVPVVVPIVVRAGPGEPATALTDDPTTFERLRFNPPSEPGVMHRRGSFGAVYRYPLTARTFAAWPDDWVLPSSSPGGAHGVWLSYPSQV
jgi:hypothetical protein